MDNKAVFERFGQQIAELIKASQQSQEITENNIYQAPNARNRSIVDDIVASLLLPGSCILDMAPFIELQKQAEQGKSCLLLMEHYSNFDLPALMYLLDKQGSAGNAVSRAILPIAGYKLNAESKLVLAFTEAYARIVIYPSRGIEKLDDSPEAQEERKKAMVINRAAMHEMTRRKHEGSIILVFPSGTRYRPGKPETKKGVKEIDSYLKSFDNLLFVGIAGNILRINPTGDMAADIPVQDTVLIAAEPVCSAKEFRDQARASAPEGSDAKQWVVDQVMERLERLHGRCEAERERILKARG